MIINGTLIDMRPYDTRKGLVVNLYVREAPTSRIVFHVALWKEQAEMVKAKLKIGDTISMSGYANGIENESQVTIDDFKLIEVKRSVVVTDQVVLLDDEQQTEPSDEGDVHD